MAQQATTANANGPIYMGASNATLTGAGTADQRRALYLKLFSGEMIKGFQHNTIARDLVTRRTLTNGRSLQFIYTGRTSSEFHVPGQSILGNDEKTPPVAEKTIECDDLLISSAFVYELDETLAHYDLRGEISRKIGYALAENYDRRIFRAITKAARQPGVVKKAGSPDTFREPGGSVVKVGAANSTTEADAYNAGHLVNAFYDAAAILDEKGVSGEGRVAVLNPRQYYALIQDVTNNGLINRDVQGTALQSGNGIIEIAGITIYKSMNIPFFGNFGTKSSLNPRSSNDNEGDFVGEAMGDQDSKLTPSNSNTQKTINNYGTAAKFAKSCGLIFQKEAAGVVEAIGPQVQVTSGDISVVYQGDVILGRLAMGADFLNPAAAVELVAGIDVSSNYNNTAVSNASFS